MFWRILASGVAAIMIGCTPQQTPAPAQPQAKAEVERREYEVRGVIQEVRPVEQKVKIKHEAIPNYMDAMTMLFEVKTTNELAGLTPGDEVTFGMVVTADDGWIEQIKKTGSTQAVAEASNEAQTKSNDTAAAEQRRFRQVREVEPLEIGHMMPDYSFTNAFGKKISFSDFKGQAFAFSFIFTRCPFPIYCPRMNWNFSDAYKQLKAMPGAPDNWHLFSISFDTEFDTPERLRTYSQLYNPDPQKWDFVTGALIDIDAITEQFGLLFRYRDGTFDHNLRTVVVDATGKIQQILVGNEWKPEELVDEIVKGAQAGTAQAP